MKNKSKILLLSLLSGVFLIGCTTPSDNDSKLMENSDSPAEETVDKTLKSSYRVDNISINNDDRVIPATVISPAGDGPYPAVVMNHGHGGSKEENGGFTDLAISLANKGILTIRMDFPGTGESKEPFTENYISNMISDSNASLDYILDKYNVDEDNLGIFGYSMGGRVAITIGSEKDTPYKAIGLLAPSADNGEDMMKNFLGGEEEFNRLYKESKSDKGYAEFTTVFGDQQTLSEQWFTEMLSSKPLEKIENFEGKLMVVYGEEDEIVPVSVNKSVLSAFPDAEMVSIKDADHGYGFYSDQPEVTNKLEKSLTNFFEENLK